MVDALQKEYQAKMEVETIRAKGETLQAKLLNVAYVKGVIDGKNADIRRRQEAIVLATADAWEETIINLVNVEYQASAAEIERKRAEAVISLTRAWLYSQRPAP